jgi:non-homologous end joining protein Ku
MHAAMVEQGKAAPARLTIYGRERIVTIRPMGPGLVLQLMRTKNEVRDMSELPTYVAAGAVTINPGMLAPSGDVINTMSSAVPDYTEYEDAQAKAWAALVCLCRSRQRPPPSRLLTSCFYRMAETPLSRPRRSRPRHRQ